MKQAYQTAAMSQGLKSVRSSHLGRTKSAIFYEAKQHTEAGSEPLLRSKRKKFAFPTPDNVCSKNEAFLCDADRVLALYNKCHGGEQKRITSPVRDWFECEARQAGWAKVAFLADIQASRSAGYMLLAPLRTEAHNVNIR